MSAGDKAKIMAQVEQSRSKRQALLTIGIPRSTYYRWRQGQPNTRRGRPWNRIIPNEEIRRQPHATFIPFWCVDAVIEVPYGSYPGNMPYEYFSDEEYLKQWLAIEKDPAAFREFFKKQIMETTDFREYPRLNGGIDKMLKLRAIEYLMERK